MSTLKKTSSSKRKNRTQKRYKNKYVMKGGGMKCELCKKEHSTEEDTMLLCDAKDDDGVTCDELTETGYHMKCLDPPLSAVPAGDWFCPKHACKFCGGAHSSSDCPSLTPEAATWVQCNECNKWRKLPSWWSPVDTANLPDEWYCWMHPDYCTPKNDNWSECDKPKDADPCEIPEEAVEEEEEDPDDDPPPLAKAEGAEGETKTSSILDKFRPKPNTWVCGICTCPNNQKTATHCQCCNAPKKVAPKFIPKKKPIYKPRTETPPEKRRRLLAKYFT